MRSDSFRCASLAIALALAGPAAAAQQSPALPKNVILMISDGTGASAIAATGMYTGKLGRQVFDGPEWIKTWSSTYPLRTGDDPISGPAGLAQDPNTVYAPSKNWDTAPVSTTSHGFPDHFAGYAWTKNTAPDSANTMSAIVNGRKSYNNAINVDGNGQPVTTFAELANRAGKAVGGRLRVTHRSGEG